MALEPTVDPAFEREKWLADVRLREREIAVKESEAAAKNEELKRSRWRDPIVLAVLAAALAAGGNAVVAVINGNLQRSADERHADAERSLQSDKATADRHLEEGKAEAARILEVIKTNDPDKAAVNLGFLLDTGLIFGDDRRKSLAAFLANRTAGQGPALPANASASPTPGYRGFSCKMKDGRNAPLVAGAIRNDLLSNVQGIKVSEPEASGTYISDVSAWDTPSIRLKVSFDYNNGNPPANPMLSDIEIVPGASPLIFVSTLLPLGHLRAEVNRSIQSTLKRISVDPACADDIR